MLTLRYAASIIAIGFALSSCSGDGSSGIPTSSALATSSKQVATGTLTIGTPTAAGTSAGARKAAYVSPATTYATLWIDSSSTGIRQGCTPGGGLGISGQCTINWTSTAGTHTFVIEVDNGALSGPGTVLADAGVVENLTAGLNSLPYVVLNGVPAGVSLASETDLGANNPACFVTLANLQNCIGGGLDIIDASGQTIVNGNYDDLGVCLQASSTIGNLSSALYSAFSCSGPVIQSGEMAFSVFCASSATGTFTILAVPVVSNASTFTGELSPAQLLEYGLYYPDQSALAVNNFPSYTCGNNRFISVSGAANGPITVQSRAAKT